MMVEVISWNMRKLMIGAKEVQLNHWFKSGDKIS